MPGGRPTIYSQEMIDRAKAYRDNPLPEDEVVHSIEGLSEAMGITRATIYDWIRQEEKQEFSDIVNQILSKQGKKLVNNGLNGKFNPSIAKVMMSKHGYREAVETDITTKGESIKLEPSEAIKIAKEYEEKLKKGL